MSCFCAVALGQEPRLYRITEHDENTFIANLEIDFELADEYTTEEINRLSFVFLEDEQELSDLFNVNGGVLQVKSPIDRENICPQLESCVIDLDIKIEPLEFYKLLKVQVEVKDVNDNAPQFNEGLALALNISESVREGTTLILPQAMDSDSPTYGTKSYEISPLSDTFSLLQDTSSPNALEPKLKVDKELDRENRDLYEFTLTAFDGGNPPKSSSINISIHVLDSNDNSPIFNPEYYAKTIKEDIPSGSSVIKVTAQDKDTGINGVVKYSFDSKTADQHGHLFTIDQTSGVIYVKHDLDYETTKQHLLTVVAKDTNPTDSGGLARVNLTLKDVNDNRPTVTLRDVEEGSSLEVSEHSPIGTFVGHVSVEDLDSGDNGKFDCVIDKSEFYLESLYATDFKLITTEQLDREIQSGYTIQMTCQDRGNPALQSSKLIPVRVTDINDKKPKFTTSTFVGNALESISVGAYIMRVTATDSDIGINAEIQYSIEGVYKDFFAIDMNTGNISSKVPLDYEREDRVQFVVMATDKGSPPLSSTATVIIDVIDEDDNVPVFTPTEFEFDVPEMELPSTQVGKVIAEDDDSDAFSHFTYGIEENKYFTIDPYSGMMYTKLKIDREATPAFRIRVFAISTTFNPSTSTAAVTVNVLDKNDNDPIITFPSPQNNTIHIPNTLTRGEIVTYIHADDNDIGQNAHLTYSIVAGNQEDFFLIDSNLGAILVHQSLQSMETKAFGIVIKVTDNGLPPRTTEAYLNIIVNKSLTSGDEMIDRTNLSIVIGIACASAIIIIILLIAILVIIIQKRRHRLSKLIYNYAPKVMDRKSYLTNQNSEIKTCSSQGTHVPSKGSRDDPDGGFTNLALENEHQLPGVHGTKVCNLFIFIVRFSDVTLFKITHLAKGYRQNDPF